MRWRRPSWWLFVSWGVSVALGLCRGSAVAQLPKRVDLNILVLSAGDVGTAMVKAGLNEGLVPYTEVDLTSGSRSIINDAFLAQTTTSVRRAKFQAIVLPSEAPPQLTAAEQAALNAYEREFKIREIASYVYPSPAVGLNWPADPGYIGTLDGLTATVTAEGKAAGFGYLNGPVPFEDLDRGVSETYGYLALPQPADTVNNRSFTSFVTMTIPGTSAAGVLLGVYNDNGRERMVLTGAMNENQTQQQLLFNGILNWLTYGVHLGTERNYFSVHIDDVFLPDARWSAANNCTVGDDCAASVNEPDIIMTAADVDFLVQWQNANGVKLDMVYNGGGYNDAVAAGPFPLGDRLLAVRSSLRWVNHTLDHLYLGCIQDFSVVPWRCATNSSGAILWTTYQDLFNQIRVNQQFSTSKGLGIVSSELVTGEHSGLRRAPQEPSDNPNLARALRDAGITWVASDNSREALPRKIGSTTTSPRYPMNIYYNTGKKTEAVDEYNWVYNAAGQGGSGVCETNAASTCIAPLDVNQDFDRYIVPQEARAMLLHMLSNSPRSHYAHQSNLAEDRILYPVLDKALASYKGAFSTQTPVVNASLTELGTELQRQVNWGAGRARISAYIQAGALNVTLGSGTTSTLAPVTVPSAATGGTLASYAGYRTGWNTVSTTTRPKYTLPSSVAYAR